MRGTLTKYYLVLKSSAFVSCDTLRFEYFNCKFLFVVIFDFINIARTPFTQKTDADIFGKDTILQIPVNWVTLFFSLIISIPLRP